MKKALLTYLAGLCQAASAALMASAVIIKEARIESIIGCAVVAVIGAVAVILNARRQAL